MFSTRTTENDNLVENHYEKSKTTQIKLKSTTDRKILNYLKSYSLRNT